MKFHRIFLALPLVALLAGVAHVSQQRPDPAGAKITAAAQKFVDSLTAEQKKKAVYAFDSAERTNWEFVPLQDNNTKTATRKGLPIQDMNPDQRKLALAVLEAGTSASGNKQATTIMSLESILKSTEKMGTMIRNPEWYFFTVFGTPGKAGKWGWRVEGHHISINYTLDNNEVICATPTFFGANPATVKDGDKKGMRILPEVEDYARELFKSLDDKQRPKALQAKQHGEPKSKSLRPTNIGPAAGVPATSMTDKQRDMLMKLVRAYADRMPPDVAAIELKSVQDAGTDKINFAYWGATEPGKGYTYRVQGPTFVIEFLNVQADGSNNPNNHIHSCWRRIDGDFGIQAMK